MMCPGFMIGLLLSLLVLMGGLFLLAYAKKEGLGKFTKIASYVAILFSTVIFVGGIICCIMMCGKNCHDGGKCGKGDMKCRKEVRVECTSDMGGNMHCEKDATEHCCKKGDSTVVVKKVIVK